LWEHRGSKSNSGNQYTIEMTKDKYDFVGKTGGRTHYQMRLDPTRTPHYFEWKSGNQVMYVGSYRLEGDRMTMIFISGNHPDRRPTDFNGQNEFRFIMRRIKRD
jgi:uncharacterized protein (TIGR03067 family)